jgi:hypothetical protein
MAAAFANAALAITFLLSTVARPPQPIAMNLVGAIIVLVVSTSIVQQVLVPAGRIAHQRRASAQGV